MISRELQEHSSTVFALAVVVMLLQLRGVRSKVRRLSDRQDVCDKTTALIQLDQTHMHATVEDVKRTLDRHDRDERGFWVEVRQYMNGGKK